MRAPRRPIHTISTWVRRQPPKVKAFLAVVSGMAALVLLRFIVHDHDNLFVAAEAVHSIGISVLIYKLMKEKTCAGKFFNFLGFFCFLFIGVLKKLLIMVGSLDFYLIFYVNLLSFYLVIACKKIYLLGLFG